MTTEEAAFRGVIFGGFFTIVGSVIGGIFSFILQRSLLKQEKRKEFYNKRLSALQSCIMLIDFISSARGNHLAKEGWTLWATIREQSFSNIGLLPARLQPDFTKVIRWAIAINGNPFGIDIDQSALDRLRQDTVECISREYG